MQVETQNASLSTMAVTIKALHVNGKQMTLAVFRQLEQKRENEQAELWGCVHYEIKDQGSIWLVFSQDGHLYRRPLDLSSPRVSRYEIAEAENKLRWTVDKFNLYKSGGVRASEMLLKNVFEDGCTESYCRERVKEYNNLLGEVEIARKNLEEEKDIYNNELADSQGRLTRETKLSKLTHLFIAV